LEIEAVPTVLRIEQGRVVDRRVGWSRADWEALTGVQGLGSGLPDYRPGCGSRSVEPGIAEELAARYGGARLRSRRILLGELEDEIEACYARGWTDGLPVVPPTRERVLRMLEGTSRDPAEVVAVVPPDLVACTVEKVAINAVLAGCRPEYLPGALASLVPAHHCPSQARPRLRRARGHLARARPCIQGCRLDEGAAARGDSRTPDHPAGGAGPRRRRVCGGYARPRRGDEPAQDP